MSLKRATFLTLSLILYINTILPSIISDILIKTPHSFVAAENIAVGDIIITYDNQTLSTATVTHMATAITDKFVAITTNK